MLGAVLALAAMRSAQAEPADPGPWLDFRLQFVLLADDDGGHAVNLPSYRLQQALRYARGCFAPAHVRFAFRPREDVMALRDSRLNRVGVQAPSDELALATPIQARYPEKIVVFVRYGPDSSPIRGSHASTSAVFLKGDWRDDRRYGTLAHELSHYFGLRHPHGGPNFRTVAQAESYLAAHRDDPACFEGDGVADTPSLPYIEELDASAHRPGWPQPTNVRLGGRTFDLLVGNVAGYYRDELPDRNGPPMTPMQIAIVRRWAEWHLAHPIRST